MDILYILFIYINIYIMDSLNQVRTTFGACEGDELVLKGWIISFWEDVWT